MSVHFWMGEGNFDTTHENKFAKEIAQCFLDSDYEDNADEFHVVFNLKLHIRNEKTGHVAAEDHDMVVLTAKKLFDIEIKCHHGSISIGQDDKWYCGKEIIKGGNDNRTPLVQVADHRYHMSDFLANKVGEFWKEQPPKFDCRLYILGTLLFPNDADVSQPKEHEQDKKWFRVINLSELGDLLSTEVSGRGAQLSSEQMMDLLVKYLKVKPAKLNKNGMPYIIKENNFIKFTGIKKVSVRNDHDSKKTETKHPVKGGESARTQNAESIKVEEHPGVNTSVLDAKSQALNREPQADAINHLNANAKKSHGEQKDVKESRKPKSANAQGCGCTSLTGHDSSAPELRKDYVDYPVTQVQVSPVRIQILEAFLRCFCSEWSPISLVRRLFRQKTGIDVETFVGYDLDTLSRDPMGCKLLKWRRADKYPHKLEVSAIGGKKNEPSPKMVSRVRNSLKDAKPEDVDYVKVSKILRLRPEKVMVAHVLKKEV